jgi:hypothetical protein
MQVAWLKILFGFSSVTAGDRGNFIKKYSKKLLHIMKNLFKLRTSGKQKQKPLKQKYKYDW